MRTYAVAATFTKLKSAGVLNLQTAIRKYQAVSEAEAIGKFVLEMSKELPDHDIHVRPVSISLARKPKEKA